MANLLPHEVIIFTNFLEDWTKIVDFLLMVNFLMCARFSYSDFTASVNEHHTASK